MIKLEWADDEGVQFEVTGPQALNVLELCGLDVRKILNCKVFVQVNGDPLTSSIRNDKLPRQPEADLNDLFTCNDVDHLPF